MSDSSEKDSTNQNSRDKSVQNSIAMALSGIALGWMIGMSASPVIKEVILSILVVFTTIMGLIGGFKINKLPFDASVSFESTPDNQFEIGKYMLKVDLLPIGLFMIFMLLGSFSGVYMRANDSLSLTPDEVAERWNFARADSSKNSPRDTVHSYIKKKLFETVLENGNLTSDIGSSVLTSADGTGGGNNNSGRTVLITGEDKRSFCEKICEQKEEELEKSILHELSSNTKDTNTVNHLKTILEVSKDKKSKEQVIQVIKLLLCPDCQ